MPLYKPNLLLPNTDPCKRSPYFLYPSLSVSSLDLLLISDINGKTLILMADYYSLEWPLPNFPKGGHCY